MLPIKWDNFVKGQVDNLCSSEQIDFGDLLGDDLHAQTREHYFQFALVAPVAAGAETTSSPIPISTARCFSRTTNSRRFMAAMICSSDRLTGSGD
jgi:hypothetical protein